MVTSYPWLLSEAKTRFIFCIHNSIWTFCVFFCKHCSVPIVSAVNIYSGEGIMPSSHLPRTPCDKSVYDFPCDVLGIVGGYGATAYVFTLFYGHCAVSSTGPRGQPRGKSVQRLCRDCTEIVQCQCSCRAVSASSARKSYGARAGIGLRTVPVQELCNATYDISTGYGLTIFSNL